MVKKTVYFLNVGKFNHPEGLPTKEEMAVMEKEAMPLYGYQLIVTIIAAIAQWYFIAMNYSNWLMTSIVL